MRRPSTLKNKRYLAGPYLFWSISFVVIRPEDICLRKPGEGSIDGVVTHLIFKGVHYEMEVRANEYDWLVHSTKMFPVGTQVSIHVDPFDIQIMKKPESEDEEAVNIEE